jgi:broad specificity phosphatase PhoE
LRFYFVRHGESESNVLGLITNRAGAAYPLTEKGRGQVEALAQNLAGSAITRIFSSPLLRAMQTAEILAARFGIGYEVTDALREFDCGILEGKSDPESWALHDEVWADWQLRGRLESRIEGGESFLDMRARFEPFLDGLRRSLEDEDRVVLVGHGGLYLNMLPAVLENAAFARSAGPSFPNASYVLAERQADRLICLEWCGIRNGRST